MRLLVDAGEFLDALNTDLRDARTSVLAQTMSFEGDRAGQQFANLLIRSECGDKRLIVDSYSRHVSSCRFIHGPAAWRDGELRREVRATAATHEAMRRAGIRIRFSNPAGPLMWRFPARNHKKTIVIDDRIAYLGGVNIADHNFAWHDLMLRIEDRNAAAFLAADLDATWRMRPAPGWAEFEGIAIGMTNGRDNARAFHPIFDVIASARDDIVVESPSLMFPFTDRLRDARRRGVRVRVIAPDAQTMRAMACYHSWECSRSGFELHLLPGMFHVKAMLVDGRRLVLGSSNFDYLSYRLLHEVLAIVDEPRTVADFVSRVAEVDLARCRRAAPEPNPRRLCMPGVAARSCTASTTTRVVLHNIGLPNGV